MSKHNTKKTSNVVQNTNPQLDITEILGMFKGVDLNKILNIGDIKNLLNNSTTEDLSVKLSEYDGILSIIMGSDNSYDKASFVTAIKELINLDQKVLLNLLIELYLLSKTGSEENNT